MIISIFEINIKIILKRKLAFDYFRNSDFHILLQLWDFVAFQTLYLKSSSFAYLFILFAYKSKFDAEMMEDSVISTNLS